MNFMKICDGIQEKSLQSSDLYHSPKFGNTEIKQDANEGSSSENKKRFIKGVGLAKQFVNLTQKLIGPKKQLINLLDAKHFFPHLQTTELKKEFASKQMTIMQNKMLNIDRVTVLSENKLTIALYFFPKDKCQRIRVKIIETPSIYLNISESKDIRVQKNQYELKNLKQGEQLEFEINGNILKTPIMMPKMQIRVNENQLISFMIPFPLIHMMKMKKPESKWLGKDFDLADKIVSQDFVRNKEMVGSLDDLDDYMSELNEIKESNKVKKYRTQCRIEKTVFILGIKQVHEGKLRLQACPLGQNSDRNLIVFFIAECMNLFS